MVVLRGALVGADASLNRIIIISPPPESESLTPIAHWQEPEGTEESESAALVRGGFFGCPLGASEPGSNLNPT